LGLSLLAYLREWVKQLILIVSLAAFLDLILPSGNIRRFARVVVGLFVLMALVNPLLLLLRQDVSWSPAGLEERVFAGEGLRGVAGQGEALAEKAKEQALALYRRQLEEQAEALVLSLEEVTRARAQVFLGEGAGDVIGLVLWVKGEGEPGNGVSLVEPVQIRVSKGGEAGSREGGEDTLPAALEGKIRAVLTTFFDLKPETISVFAWEKDNYD